MSRRARNASVSVIRRPKLTAVVLDSHPVGQHHLRIDVTEGHLRGLGDRDPGPPRRMPWGGRSEVSFDEAERLGIQISAVRVGAMRARSIRI